MTKTTEELGTQILANLGVIEAGQTPSDEDLSTAIRYIPDALETLSELEIVSIDDANAIRPAFFLPLAILIANYCALEFGEPVNAAAVAMAKLDFKIMTRGRPTGEPQTVDYF